MRNISAIFFCMAILNGCATLSEAECESADWHLIGYEDGVRGYDADRIGVHRKSCAEYGMSPNLDEYLAGRDDGLVKYCTVANGFKLAKSGRAYNGVCPKNVERDFLDGFSIGEEVRLLEAKHTLKLDEYERQGKALEDIKVEIMAKETLLVSQDTSVQDRLDALDAMRQMEDKHKEMKENYRALESEINNLEVEIKELESHIH